MLYGRKAPVVTIFQRPLARPSFRSLQHMASHESAVQDA